MHILSLYAEVNTASGYWLDSDYDVDAAAKKLLRSDSELLIVEP